MGLAVNLLGVPHVTIDGVRVPPPRGNKPWALLAYLARADHPVGREHLARLVFEEADDPAAALRWNLTALRRLLREPDALRGDPLRLDLPADATVDVDVVTSGSWTEALRVPGLGATLLEGMHFDTCPGFDLWLAMERRHLEGIAEGVLHEAAQARLAEGDAASAVELATRLVQLSPLDENLNALLVQALVAAGDREEAVRHAARCRDLFRRALGKEPSPALELAMSSIPRGERPGRHTVRAALLTGEAAIAAGTIDTGLDQVRRAVAGARAAGDPQLLAEALLALGGALVHAARGRDEEAGASLHEALSLAQGLGLTAVAAGAARELGYVEFLRARYERAEVWLGRAAELAGADDRELAAVGVFHGSVLTDTGRTGASLAELRTAVERATRADAARTAAFGLSMIGRAHLLRGEIAEAGEPLHRSVEIAEREWTSFVPYPLSFLADAHRLAGDLDAASEASEHAFALGCQIGDPCWEGLAARGLGLLAEARGDVPGGVRWLEEADARCMRLPDTWLWARGYVLDALCELGARHALAAFAAWTDTLEQLASRTGMKELLARSCLRRAQLGDAGAAQAAAALVADVDNPSVTRLVTR